MTGNVALDVVIGLVFIFLLYSLLATIIQEIVANFLGLRARNLRHGITRMLKDETKVRSNNIASRVLLDSKQNIQRNFTGDDGLVKAFYEEPVIKYLASGRYFSKPSYISAPDFSKAVLEILKKLGGDGPTTIDKIKLALSDPDNIIDDETRTHMLSLLEDAQNDLVKFKLNLEQWFDHTMQRVTGWYKRTVQFSLIVIGLILAMLFNVSTLEVASILSNDEKARDSMVALASAYVKENEDFIESYNNDKLAVLKDSSRLAFRKKLDTLLAEKGMTATEAQELIKTLNFESDSATAEYDSELKRLLEVKAELEADIEDVNQILGFRPIDSLPLERKKSDIKLTLKQRPIKDGDTEYVMNFPSLYLADKTATYYEVVTKGDGDDKTAYAEFNDLKYILHNFWGYFITALAISLGAPFWFDLLSKLIRIRSSVPANPKNASDKNNAPSGAVSVNQRVG